MPSASTHQEQTANQNRPVFAASTFGAPAFGAVTLAALAVGFYSLRYALPHVPVPAPLPNFTLQRKVLIVHAVCASMALLAGPWQFIPALRRTRPALHRTLGRIYLTAVAVAWVSSFPLALGALGGAISTAGFVSVGFAWIGTSGAGLRAILQGRIAAHQDWMTRSYALTAAAITLRLYLMAALLLHLPFIQAYRAISWLSWVPNLLVAEMLLRRRHQVQRSMSLAPHSVPAHSLSMGHLEVFCDRTESKSGDKAQPSYDQSCSQQDQVEQDGIRG